jgi:hypothetical protein
MSTFHQLIIPKGVILMNYARGIFISVYTAMILAFFAFVSFKSAPGIQPGFGLSQMASEHLVYRTGVASFMLSGMLFAWAFILIFLWLFTPKPIQD